MAMVSVLHVSLADAPDGVDGRVNSVSYSKCGGYFYTTTNDGVLGLYDAGTGSRLSEFHVKDTGCRLVTATHHPMGVLHASGLPPLKRDAPPDSGLDVGQVVYHNLHENKIMRVFRGHKDRVTSISMNPANDLFLTTSLDGTFRVWDLRTSSPVAVGPLASSSAEAAAAVTGAAIPTRPPQALSDVLEARGSFDNTGKIFAVAVSIAAERNGAPISLTMYNAERIGEPQEAGRCFFPARANYESKERERDNAFHPVHRLSFPNREVSVCVCVLWVGGFLFARALVLCAWWGEPLPNNLFPIPPPPLFFSPLFNTYIGWRHVHSQVHVPVLHCPGVFPRWEADSPGHPGPGGDHCGLLQPPQGVRPFSPAPFLSPAPLWGGLEPRLLVPGGGGHGWARVGVQLQGGRGGGAPGPLPCQGHGRP